MKGIYLNKLLLVSGLIFGLSGCFTTELLPYSTQNAIQHDEKATVIHQDLVTNFILDKDTGRLVMIGRDYVYVFDNDKATTMVKNVLQYKGLDVNGLRILTPEAVDYKLPYRQSNLMVRFDPNTNKFRFLLHLKYSYKNDADVAFFKANGFRIDTTHKIAWLPFDSQDYGMNDTVYLSGTVYKDQSPQVTALRQASSNLAQSYLVNLYTVGEQTKIHPTSLLARVALLPFALVGDVITAPVQWALKDAKINP